MQHETFWKDAAYCNVFSAYIKVFSFLTKCWRSLFLDKDLIPVRLVIQTLLKYFKLCGFFQLYV